MAKVRFKSAKRKNERAKKTLKQDFKDSNLEKKKKKRQILEKRGDRKPNEEVSTRKKKRLLYGLTIEDAININYTEGVDDSKEG